MPAGRADRPCARQAAQRTIISVSTALACLAASFVALWGVAHAVPTRTVIADFGAISADNRRVITQEWLAEALTMWFLAAVVLIVTAVAGAGTPVAEAIYLACAVMLGVLAILTALTGARTPVIWFKICPALLGSAAGLLLAAALL